MKTKLSIKQVVDDEQTEVNWTCPNCGRPNLDIYQETAFPLCEGCGLDFVWSEIVDFEYKGGNENA